MKAGQMDEAEEVLDVVFPSGRGATEVVHPGAKPLRYWTFRPAPVAHNQFDRVFLCEPGVERVRA